MRNDNKDNNFSSLNIKIRNVLLDIIQNTYEGKVDEGLYQKYRKFYLICSPKQVKSYAGQYNMKERSITIVGLTRNPKHIVVTTIHELAHHIDNCNRGNTDHSSLFYEEYKKMLHTALNMRVFAPEDAECIKDVTDGKKVAKMIAEWQPAYIPYRDEEMTVRVYNCFEQRNTLKERGYKWQAADKSWEKSISKETLETELEYLKSIVDEENIKINDSCELDIKVTGYIIAGKGSYEQREELKKNGFHYDKMKKVWKKSVTENMQEILKELKCGYPMIEFKYTVGK